MYDRLNVPLSLTWEIYGDTEATFNDCFRMFNPTTREKFEEVRLSTPCTSCYQCSHRETRWSHCA